MYVCMYVCIHIRIHAHIHIYIYIVIIQVCNSVKMYTGSGLADGLVLGFRIRVGGYGHSDTEPYRM